MASRRQKQFDRKYSSYRKYTSTNDVNYSTHSSRSSYRSESLTSREDGRGRSTSSELISGSETRSYPVYIAIQDYSPDKEDIEGIPLEQGQIVEVLDKKNSVRWLVRTKARPPRSGWVPGSYFETPTEFYKQRRRTREIENVSLSDEQAALVKRDQVYHELLRSEEEFVSSLRSCVDGYIKVFDDASVPDAVKKHRDQLVLNIPELYNFHANVMLKGLNYYSDDPGKVGQTFVRLEKDFESHVEFYKNYNQTLQLLQQPEIDKFLQALSNKNDAGASTFADHINEIADRMVQYQNYFKEFVKYSARVQGSSKSVQKALELVTTIPQRVQDLKFINNIRQYPGDTNKLGRIIRHDAFQVWEGDEEAKTRYVFLFRNKMMFTEQKTDVEPSIFIHYSTIRLDKYNIREHTTDETIILQPKEPGLPHFRIKPKDLETSEYVKKAWLKDVGEEQELYAAERDAVSLTATSEMTASSMDLDVNVSDAQSEFSEWSGSRKSSLYPGPEEGGPPRKKVKSPPVISPTGSSASIYSGGSSSIDWTTTGTTLEMQGTRVTRTQYGFRTLQESSAKMCLKVTGYPLPDITWYKDDVLLSEDERHTFYSDEDGFFAMTIDPVQVTDTGRYTCMATNEYGQASTSAFFRVLKVEKEAAPPAFVTKLQDKDCKEGDVIDFECEVEGWPEPELVWLVDDQPLRPSQDFRLQYDGQTAKLEIRDAQPDDTGVYTVKIQNEFGSSESKAELFVEADPDKNHVAPEFQATIEDVECNEGDEVRFKSVITGDPNPEITWLINGVPLSESEKVKFISEDGICILTIKDVTRHFDGLITCQGSNRLGTSTCDAQLKIRIPPAPPAFNKPLEDKTVQEKSTVSFEIDVTGWPKPIISITLAGKELKNGEDGTEITGQDGFYRITIPTVSIEKHDGEIIARAQNEHGTAESRARLTVDAEEEESRSAPTFIKDIEDQTVKSGELAIFETSVRGNPNPEVTWFVNGHKMDSSSPGVKIEAHNHDHKLTIDSAQYAGTVLCRAENAVGRFETKARLVVLAAEKPKRAPKFTEVLTDKTEVVENHLTFEVRVEGEPKPTVTWYLNGNQIQQSEHFEIREFDGSIKLQIKNLKFEDAGEIKAVATNSEGSDETKATIVVQKKPFAPEFDLRPATQTVEKGSEAIFKAHAFGIPIPTYSWSINGRKVREGQDGARVSTDGIGVDGASILTIDTATYYSEANQLTISVVAENSLGAEETGAQLIVEPKKTSQIETKADKEEKSIIQTSEADQTAAAPIITRDLQSQTVNKSELAHFEVVVENATSIQWFHNGTPISSSTTAGVKLSNDDQFEFRASLDSNCFENGTVSIRASNESGQIETKADLIVLEPPKETKKPEFTDKLKDVEVIQGDDLQMDVIALNSPEFKWFQNGNELENGKNGVEVINNENKSTLIIRNAQASGIISVEASNQIGKAESSGKLTVKPPATVPIIVDGPKSMKVKENERVEFSATINGYPEPTIKWLINDRIVEESTKINASRQENVYSLSISNVATEDGGKIKVTAQNSAGSDSKEADLVVEPNVSAPRFKNQLIDKIGDEGEPLRWNIEVENPTPGTNLKWFLNGKPLEANDQLLISDNGKGVYSLTIADAKPDEHNGQISAKVKNESGEEAETTAKVEIKPGNRKPEFVQKPQNHETTIEESVKFSAIVSGKPMPNVSWYLNDRKLIQSDEIKVKYVHESGKTSIRIHKPLKEHNGIIRIVAENVAGKVEATAELKVDKKFEVPKIITNMDDRQVKEGENVKYTTSVEGYPEPTVEWKLNGEPVNQYPNITVTDNQSGEHTIEIIAIQPEQAGELSCEATNSIGTKKRDVQLAVKKVGDAPTFAKNLEDQLITEGEATVMSAKLNPVKPKPKVQWLKDGVELKADDHLKLIENDDGSLELNIASTKLDDKGRITIKAENDFGVAECAASLGVVKGRPMAKPVFQSSIPLISLTEGESLECKLLITGDPTPFVKWYIEGQLVCATEDTEITNANGVYTLKIHGVTSDMTGKIKCVAYNKAGEASTEGQLKVVAPIPVEFETSLCDATCREGDTLKLKAVLLGEPEPVVSWYVNGKKLEESQNIKIHAEKGTYTVTIKDITCDYSGQVVCEAVNEYGKATSEATLLVLPRGEPPDFIEWLSNVRARTGSKVVHKVVFTGDPKPTLTWYINNAEIRNSNDYSIVTDDKTSVLTINNFNADVHVGEIICKAENDAGEVSCTANMLTYTSDMFSESESEAQAEEFVGDDLTEDESFRDEMHRTPTPVMAPKFITKIKDAKTKKGHSAVFECVVPDTKGVCCKWLKDGKEIELIARIRVKTLSGPEGHVAQQLIIDDVEEEDAGKYTCIVENSSGADKCEATLTVVESFDKAPNRSPEFIVALQDKTTKTSEKVLLECKAIGEPRPNITWYHDDKIITSNETTIIETVEGVERVTISSSELKHQGKYTCVAENSEGTTKTESFLTVQGEAPQFTKELQNKEVSIGEKLILSCSVKGTPQPHVEFYRSSEATHIETKLVSTSRIAIEHDQSNTHWRMVISEVQNDEICNYKAIATNSFGSTTSMSKITSKIEKPVIEQGLKTTTVKESEELKMEVKVGGKGVDVDWFKDGQPIVEDTNQHLEKNPDAGVYAFVVEKATRKHSGYYTVKARNSEGEAESGADVEILEQFKKPIFVQDLIETRIKLNETSTLSVIVEGVPEPVIDWLKDGRPINIDSSHIMNKLERAGHFEFVIKNATLDDSGIYTCRASNPVGEAKSEANLTIVKDLIAPEFVEKLVKVEVKENETAKLAVKVIGTPKPTVQWLKDDQPINIDGSHLIEKEIDNGSFVLTINQAKLEDVGTYSCKARNEAGDASTSAHFGLIRTTIAPEFTEKLKPLEVEEKASLSLNVTVTGTPQPTIEWFKDDQSVNIDGNHLITKTDGNGHHSLIITSARSEDVGVYSCKATNEAGEAKTTANIGIQEDIEAPLFIDGLKRIEIEEGKDAELKVKVEGKPEPKVEWFKDEAPLQIDNHHLIVKKEEDGVYSLIIKNTTIKDFGKYSCKAINKAGKDETIGELQIPKYSFEKQNSEETKPLFIEPLNEMFAKEGDVVILKCKINKESQPTIKFYKNDSEVVIGDDYRLDIIDDGSIQFTIRNAKKEDVGAYKCEALNQFGKADTVAQLTVQYGSTIVENIPDETGNLDEISPLQTLPETASSKTDETSAHGPPEFIELLRSSTVVEKQQAILRCRVKGEPTPKIRWTKNGKEVEMSARVRADHKDDGTLTLTLDDVTKDDAGEYKCEAKNDHGNAWTEGPIIVTLDGAPPKTDGEAPDFLEPVRPAVVNVGETARLEGKLTGKPKPTVKWYKNGEELKPSPKVTIENLDDGTQRLTIKDAQLSDQDEYRCSASNEFGDVWSDVTLNVKEKPTQVAPEFFEELQAIQVKETETATFECKISGTTPNVRWFKEGNEIKEDSRIHFISQNNGLQQLIIEQSKAEDQANYRIEISNESGTANSKAPLTVIPCETLKIKRGLNDVTTSQGSKIILSVEVEGKPKTVKWYKGSETLINDDHTRISQITDTEFKLEIEKSQIDDNGSYRVVLSTGTLSVESSANVIVTKLTEKISLPSFKKGLADQSIPKGSALVLEVEIDGKPNNVKWYKNGKEVSAGDKPKIETIGDGKYRLTIPDFTADDVGNYSVTASNEAGEIESRADVSVKDDDDKKSVEARPEIVSGLIPININQGETARFNVKVKGAVKSVKWLKNGNEIPDGKSIQKGDGEFELEIPNAQLDDNADYKVVLSNDAGDADSSARLTVKLPQIKIVKGLKDQEVPKGSLAVLEVETNQKPKSVKWYKNGKEIDGSDKAKPGFNGDNKPQLLIPDSSDVDAADYKIVLTDDDGNTADSSCSLCVKLPAEQPKIIKGLEDQTVAVGSPIKLEIETSGSPKSVKWLKNGKEVAGAAAAKIRIQKIDDNNYVLEIPASEVNDSGDYKVEVSNEAGADNSSAKIIVEPKITFIKPLKDQTITESETGEFLVETNTQPKTIKWYKNGQEIQPDSRILLQQINDTKFSLIIKNSTRDDAAVYKVVLSNSAGDAETSATLTVNKAKAGVCRILKGLDDQIVAKGAAMVFEVKIEGEAEDVRWLKNGSLISPSANAVIEKINDSTYRLTIPSSDVDDAGEYTVEVVNSGGKVKSNASGEVDEKPEIVRQLQNLDLSEGDDDVFKVEVNTPIRNVKWYKNGQEIEPTKHLEPKKIGPKKYELKINRALLDDAADYKVILSNKAGECDSSASLTVTKPNLLKILDGLKDVEVDENQPINLKVKIDGIPKTVKWYKNGQEIQANDQIQINENPETGEYSLLIPSSKRSDGGPYRVVLTSDKNEVYSGSVAHVKAQKPKEPQSAPNFISPLKDCEVEEGDILTLQCIIGGQPFPDVKWLKDGVEILKDDRISMRSALDGTTTLRIRSAKKSDIGRYEVVATNDLGSLKSDCSVNVKDQDEQPAKPKFVIPLRTCSALPGEKKEFHVKIRGTPKPTLKWFLNNQPIEFDDRILIEDLADGNYCLTIKEVQDKDFGTIRCVATNEHGSDETIAEFEQGREHDDRSKDDLRYPPRFNVPLWDRRIPVGDPMFIECHVDANPTADIEWFKDGVKIQHSSHIEIRNTIDGACRLKIIPFDESDCGSYKCVAINDLGQAETQSIYSVEVVETVEELKSKEYAPRINPGLEDQCVTNGSAIHLSCKVDAIPRASVVWYKDGLPLRNDSRISINYNDDGTAQLSIQQSIESDIGAYRCVATNAHGTTNTSCSVNVKVTKQEIKKEGEEPFFTKGLADLWTDRGETFTLKCAVVGDPKPDIKWYRNGQLIRNGPRTLIETTPDGVCTLIVKDSTMSDEGIYRCEAENAHGKAKTQATAHVQMALGKTEKPKIDDGKPPKFILELSDTTVSVGSLIDIECKVTGQPIPTVKWSKDGGPLIEDSRFEWSNDEAKGVYQLRIKKSTIHDEGTYRCVATNENGSATTKSFIRIDDGIGSAQINTGQAPRFTLKLGDVRAVEGQPLKLECKIEANPLPEIVWYKDGAIVEGSERIQISLSPDGVATLTIPSCVYDDDGIYRIIATNPNGTAQDKGTATVKKLPKGSAGAGRRSAEPDAFDVNKAPKLIEPLENVRIPEKQGFKLRCKFSGDPKPTIKWFKDGERVFPYGRLQLNELPDGVCELIIDSSIRQDSGGYRCVAENTFGSARTSADVNIIRGDRKPKDLLTSANTGRAPGFTIPLTIRRAKPNESVTFECLPFGQPFPSIKWLKDGLELMADDGIHMESADDGTQRLILSNVSFLSEGYYRCVATNEHGTASTKAELIIEGDRSIGSRPPPTQADAAAATNGEPEESKPRIRRGLYNMSIHEGNVVEMIVCATGWPTPTVKWFKDGEEVISDGADGKRLIFTDERGIHHLVIVNANSADEGEYSLEATNKLGSAKTEGSLNIILPRHLNINDDRGGMPFPPGFVRQLKNKHVFNRMPTIFDCLVVGHPAPDVEWFHNGKKIVQGGRIKIQSCGGGSHALIILDTTLDDAGEYVAVAKNSHGTASSSAVLDVTVPFLDNIKFNGEIDVTPYLTEEYGFKKLNTASLPTPPDHGPFIKEVTGHYLTLSWIPTKRAPPRYPQVTYVIEIRQLPEKEWTLLDYNIPEPVCKVRNLELGKSYQFRVRAENIYGISDPSPASPPSRLMAPPQPVFDRRTNKIIPLLDPYAEKALELRYAEQYACAPWFAPGVVEKRYCAENDTLTIVLNVSGYPDPEIVWKFRGWDIDTTSPTSKLKIYTYGGSETTLVISGFTKENVGQYQCFAKNEYGEAQQNVLVELATLPKFIQQLSNKTFSSAHPLKLDVRVEGDPFPELKWMKEWRPIVESSRIKFVQDGPYLCSLIINDPMWRDSGIYSCVASNDAGQTTTSCTVTVEAEGDYNDVEIPRRRVTIESRKVRELYEITEADEKLAAEGAPFCVTERATARRFLAQLRPIDDSLLRHTDIHNSLDHPGIVQMHRVLRDQQLALVVFDNANSTIDGLSSLTHPGVRVSEPSGANRETCVRVFVRQLLLALQHMHSLRIAHLDLRPETILLQDDKLKLADFGQSRRLLRGLITGEIKGSPEFVSPEIVRSLPLTLATDMWSTGVLTYVLLTGLSPFHGDNDNETLANVDRCEYEKSPLGNFSFDASDFVQRLLLEIPAHRMTVDEALNHPWINDEELKNKSLSADTLREFQYQHKWLTRRVFVQQTPSEQILEAILSPQNHRIETRRNERVAGSEEGRRPAEIYEHLRVRQRDAPHIEEVPPPPPRRQVHPPFVDEFGELIDSHQFDQSINDDFSFDQRRPPRIPPQPQRSDQPAHDSKRFEPLKKSNNQYPSDQYGRPVYDPRSFNDPSQRPTSLEDPQIYVDKFGHQFVMDRNGQPHPLKPEMLSSQNAAEKRKLMPQDKGETPSRSKKEKMQAPHPTGIPEEGGGADSGDIQRLQIPLRMIRGERREIEEEIANRILSDISEEGSIAGSLASLEDFEIPKDFQVETSEPSTPTLTPEITIRETIPKSPTTPTQLLTAVDANRDVPSKTVSYSDRILSDLPEIDRKILEQAENDPSIPVGAPLFLEGIHGDLTIDTTSSSGLIKVTSPALNTTLSPKSPRRSTPGTKSPVILSPRQEHSMEVLIATKRGKPGFLPPGELAPEIDDEDAFMDKKKKTLKPKDHDDDDDFKDEKDKLVKDKNRRSVNLNDLDKYRPSNYYKDDDDDLNHAGYDIDDSPWDSHYQIGPDTYLMAARGAAFNSRVRNYRSELFGVGAPLVRQGFLGVRNRDITVRERRRYTDILRETTQGVEPKKTNESRPTLLQKNPSSNAIDRIKADIEKVAPSATRKNEDGTFAPIFTSRLRDVYLRKNQPAIFECSVSGSPQPNINWEFQGRSLKSDDKILIENDPNSSRLTILKAAPYDLGEYVCSASNEFGIDKTSCRLISGETPSRPGRPDCELSSDTELLIQWEAPEGPTYLEGITYRLEYRPAGPDDHSAPWITISDKIDDESVVVKHLSPLGIYQFRVTAQNGFGFGVPSLSSRIVQTHGKGAPKLQIDVLKKEIRLNVVSMPQKSTNQLGGITEESEEDLSMVRTLQDDIKITQQVETSDPTGRFQIAGIKFKGKRSIIRDAVDSSTETGAHCVVKIRHPSSEAMSEYQQLRDGQHENVQKLIATFDFNNFLFIFTEKLYEDVFSRFVFNDYYTEEQVAITIRQLTAAIHFLHFRGIAHLDVNPHNIMFQSKRSWIVKLIDFGRAQRVETAVKPLEFDTKWAPPEFHIPETSVTVQSDVWGMGVVTFCLLAGFHPFTSEYDREDEIKENVINVKCDPNLIPVNASQECLSFSTWALKKSPLRRMRTDEALSHKFLSSDPSMVRRRESIRLSASRLRKLAAMIRQPTVTEPISEELEKNYGN